MEKQNVIQYPGETISIFPPAQLQAFAVAFLYL